MLCSRRRCLQLLEKCRTLNQLHQAHSQLIISGFKDSSFALSRLVALSAHSIRGNLLYAWKLFQRIQVSSTWICNALIKVFLANGTRFFCYPFRIYSIMLREGISPDPYTFSYLLQASRKMESILLGESLHGSCRKFGLIPNNFVANRLLSIYLEFGCLNSSRHLFDEILIGLSADVVSWTLMISGYAKLGDVEMAKSLFDLAPCKDLGVWGAMASGYMQNNFSNECLTLFPLMQKKGVIPDEGIFSTMLSACARLGALEAGAWIHRHLLKTELQFHLKVQTALIDMYAKTGRLDIAKEIFERVLNKDVVCWNAMIFALAWHGDGDGARKLFAQMEENGCRPDDLTFLAVLTACSHSGLGHDGIRLIARMWSFYGVKLKSQHYGCVVELLGRMGLLKEAEETVRAMPSERSHLEEAVAWRALVDSCCDQGHVELAEYAANRSLELDCESDAHVLLANWFAAANKHGDADRVRGMMKDRGLKKSPGCSAIQG